MAKPFDATLNELIDEHAADWAALLCPRIGIPIGTVELLDTDLATTLQADSLFRIGGSRPSIIHLELEGNHRLGIPEELLRYNVHVHGIYGLPVETIILLLRSKDNPSDITGEYTRLGANSRPNVWFRYTVIRLWEEPMAPLMNGGLGTLPLALLTNEAQDDLGTAFDQFQNRLQNDSVSDTVKEEVTGAAYRLLELRVTREVIRTMLKDVDIKLEDTTIYRWIEGLAIRRALLQIATKKLGPPTPEIRAALKDIDDPDHLSRINAQVLTATTWDELLATP